MLVLTRKKDEKIIIDNNIEVTIVEIESGKVKLGIDAPLEVDIVREEVYRQIEAENKASVEKPVDIEDLLALNDEDNNKN